MSEFGAEVFRVDSDSAQPRFVDAYPVPGRSGSLIMDGKKYENVDVSYLLFFCGANAESNCSDAKQYLLSQIGYQVLEDTEHPLEFRKGYVSAAINPTITRDRKMFRFRVNFNCKPQRYLASGQSVTTLTADGSITNPTLFDSQPLMRVYGVGALGVGSQTVTITQADEYTDIDSEMMDAFKGTANKNPYVQLTDHNFPVFKPGVNNISLGTGITKVEITPRWWIV